MTNNFIGLKCFFAWMLLLFVMSCSYLVSYNLKEEKCCCCKPCDCEPCVCCVGPSQCVKGK